MTYLITFLIALLGYGTPADFSNMTQAELEHEISAFQSEDDPNLYISEGGRGWEYPQVNSNPSGE